MCSNPCQQQLLRRLARLGSWADREQVAEGIGFPAQRVDDELQALTEAGAVVLNPRSREWRLAGTPLARRAAQRLLEQGLRRTVLAAPENDGQHTRLGMALYTPAGELVTAELRLPLGTQDLAGQLDLALRVQEALA